MGHLPIPDIGLGITIKSCFFPRFNQGQLTQLIVVKVNGSPNFSCPPWEKTWAPPSPSASPAGPPPSTPPRAASRRRSPRGPRRREGSGGSSEKMGNFHGKNGGKPRNLGISHGEFVWDFHGNHGNSLDIGKIQRELTGGLNSWKSMELNHQQSSTIW